MRIEISTMSEGVSCCPVTTNTVNQYLRKYRPLGFGVMGTAGVNESVLVNGLEPTYRRGEYFWKWMSVTNSTSPLWLPVEVISGSETNTGSIFMAGRPELFSYDLGGNMLSDGRWDYTWDAENRLISMTVNTNVGPQLQLDFQYDWMGRRISKTVKTNGVTSYSRKFLYDGWNLIAELDGNNALVRSYTWGLDLSGTAQGAGGVGGLLMVNAGTNAVHFPAYDLNGNVMGLINATNGIISAKYEYGPFGEVFCSVGDMASVNPFGFSTKYTDSETDLVYYGYRYYSPSLGRWLSRDPIEEQGGLNLYGFVNNDPVNKWDKLGLKANTEMMFWYKDEVGRTKCCIRNNELPGVKMGFRKFDEGISYRLWHAYLQIGDSWKDWTIGWSGNTYSETESNLSAEEREKALRHANTLKRKNKGYLPSGIPCKCATALQIQECVKNAENYPIGSYDPLFRNCGDWAGKLAKKCCLNPNYWLLGNRIWYGPTFGWTKD